MPPKARTADEIDWRRSHPAGSVLAEQEYRGLLIASKVLKKVHDEPDVAYAASLIAASGLNSSWYDFVRYSDVMRRRVHLPVLGRGEQGSLLGQYNTLDNARMMVDHAAVAAQGLMRAVENGTAGRARKAVILGRTLGEASLALACVPDGERVRNMTPFMAQAWVREQGLHALQQARGMAVDLGTHPSIAQFADPTSDIAVAIRRHAPNVVEQAFDEALTEHAMPL